MVLTAELGADSDSILRELSTATGRNFYESWLPLTPRVRLFHCLGEECVRFQHVEANGALAIHRALLDGIEVLIAAVHLPSKLHWDEAEQAAEAQHLSAIIRRVETDLGHDRTILIGDFNMNPFELGLIQCHAFHGVMTRQLALERGRIVQDKSHPFFYNPMWGFFGDRSAGPPGTYFYRSATPRMYFWNIFDQVLFRPSLFAHFQERVGILAKVCDMSLVNENGIPNQNVGSDHLPVLFELKFNHE